MLCSCLLLFIAIFFFFDEMTGYEMRIGDWSSDVCPSDLADQAVIGGEGLVVEGRVEQLSREIVAERPAHLDGAHRPAARRAPADLLHQLAECDAKGRLEQAGMADVARKLDRHRPARTAHAKVAVGGSEIGRAHV